jgi:5-methylcytosine-specific restriction endonuclease McrA
MAKCNNCDNEITQRRKEGSGLCRKCWRRNNDKKNAKKIKRQVQARKLKNPKKYAEYGRKWKENNLERAKQLWAESKDRKRFGGNRQEVLERDNFQCQECGMTQEQHFILYNKCIAIHHIDGKGIYSEVKNNNLDNLITLCYRCHMLIHKNPDKKIIKEFSEKINEWIVMLDSPDFEENDAGLVREEMVEFINKSGDCVFSAESEPTIKQKIKHEIDKGYDKTYDKIDPKTNDFVLSKKVVTK